MQSSHVGSLIVLSFAFFSFIFLVSGPGEAEGKDIDSHLLKFSWVVLEYDEHFGFILIFS